MNCRYLYCILNLNYVLNGYKDKSIKTWNQGKIITQLTEGGVTCGTPQVVSVAHRVGRPDHLRPGACFLGSWSDGHFVNGD